jgi:hypothetical protein
MKTIANSGYLGPITDINIGNYVRPFYHSIGSIELYLKAFDASQVATAMNDSRTYMVDPEQCPDFF